MKTEADISIHHKPLKTHKDLVEEFYSGITLHGFRFLFEGTNYRRVTWFIICSAVFAFSIYLFESLLNDYLAHKVNTSISRRYATGKFDFPTIVICPLGKAISSTKYDNYPIDIGIDDLKNLKRYLSSGNKEKDHNSSNTARFIQDLIQKGIDTKTKFINSYNLPFEEIFQSDVLEHL
eukprot:TCONS_00045918-protein